MEEKFVVHESETPKQKLNNIHQPPYEKEDLARAIIVAQDLVAEKLVKKRNKPDISGLLASIHNVKKHLRKTKSYLNLLTDHVSQTSKKKYQKTGDYLSGSVNIINSNQVNITNLKEANAGELVVEIKLPFLLKVEDTDAIINLDLLTNGRANCGPDLKVLKCNKESGFTRLYSGVFTTPPNTDIIKLKHIKFIFTGPRGRGVVINPDTEMTFRSLLTTVTYPTTQVEEIQETQHVGINIWLHQITHFPKFQSPGKVIANILQRKRKRNRISHHMVTSATLSELISSCSTKSEQCGLKILNEKHDTPSAVIQQDFVLCHSMDGSEDCDNFENEIGFSTGDQINNVIRALLKESSTIKLNVLLNSIKTENTPNKCNEGSKLLEYDNLNIQDYIDEDETFRETHSEIREIFEMLGCQSQ